MCANHSTITAHDSSNIRLDTAEELDGGPDEHNPKNMIQGRGSQEQHIFRVAGSKVSRDRGKALAGIVPSCSDVRVRKMDKYNDMPVIYNRTASLSKMFLLVVQVVFCGRW